METDYKITLDVFEGPLDLLLHLVKKHELDVLEIPVAFIAEKYLSYLEVMRQMNLEIAGEYLLMAATLAHLKSKELLPTKDPGDEKEDPDGESEIDTREQLIKRLLEYQKYRDAAESLGDRPVVGRNVWTRGAAITDITMGVDDEADAPLDEVPVFKLIEALSDVLARTRVKLTHDVIVERLTITDRINALVDRLEAEGTFSFRSCFAFVESGELIEAQLRHEVVVTFLAILEMAKLKLIRLSQPQPDGDGEIQITRAVEDVKAKARAGMGGGSDEYR